MGMAVAFHLRTLGNINYWITLLKLCRYCSLSSGIKYCFGDTSSQSDFYPLHGLCLSCHMLVFFSELLKYSNFYKMCWIILFEFFKDRMCPFDLQILVFFLISVIFSPVILLYNFNCPICFILFFRNYGCTRSPFLPCL